ncbi:MAG: peptidylprolyl isomerase [Candidatus Thiodiazotropha sp. (ex Monitilora ramsayi)]|nr:peptidylprolyl isomerase [Candidatus Thiodiazotropha sp. (ex Monitilora ramsayi)]
MIMKKQILLASLCSTVLLVGCNQTADKAPTVPAPAKTETAQEQAPAQTEMDENTLLTVNGEQVSKAMYGLYFQDRMRNVPDAQNSPQMQMSVLNELSNVLIVAQDAEKKGIDKRPEIQATLTLLKAKLLTQTVIQEYAESHQPTDEQIKTYYEAEYASQGNKEYKARHILVKEEEAAKSLITELDGGADFAELAKTHSTGQTGKNGGDLGWFDPAQMVQPFSEAVVSMEKGSYTKTPVQTQFGWHVILLEDSRDTEAPTLDGVRGDIITKLQQQSLAAYMQGLRDESTIVFNEMNAVKAQPADSAGAAPEESKPMDDSAATEAVPAVDTSASADEAKPASE